MKRRLDQTLVDRGLVKTRSQAEDIIHRGFVKVGGQQISKASFMVNGADMIKVQPHASFVSRAGEKLHSVISPLDLDFKDKLVLDVGSSTGGFTDVCLRYGAKKVIAVDVGTDQMDTSLRQNPKIELHEKTDIRSFRTDQKLDVVVADVSFISLREILPYITSIVSAGTEIIAMVKPQFEAATSNLKHKGVIKNDKIRREILRAFETWAQDLFVIEAKADSKVSGSKGNVERFYKLKTL